LITGGATGIGACLVEQFAAQGARVGFLDIDADAGAALAQHLAGSRHAPLFVLADLTDIAALTRGIDAVRQHFGPIGVLLNNAATINRNAPLWEVTPEDFSRVVDVNLKGIHLVCRGFLPAMIARGTGIVVNFSSGWGRLTSPEVAPYCCTKWGVEGLTQALAQELPPGLAAVALNPGVIDTDMLRRTFGSDASDYPDPANWAVKAVPFLEKIGPSDNGKALTVPQ
jgi:NAD(P)-dependent dehydrogenase (short-subunit alcohol dehydrogenase family)